MFLCFTVDTPNDFRPYNESVNTHKGVVFRQAHIASGWHHSRW